MKIQKLSENNFLPDFSIAIGITLFIIIFSILISFLTMKFSSIFSDASLLSLWGMFSYSVLIGVLLWIIFIRYRTYIIQLLKYPFTYFIKGLYYYLLFIPVLFVITLISFSIFKMIGLTPTPQEIILIYLQTDSFYLLFTIFFLSCIVAPFVEEIIFRGIIYTGLKTRFSVLSSIILSSLIFTLLHNELFALTGLFAFGFFLSYVFEKYQNLWLSIGIHFFNNFFTTIIILIVKHLYTLQL